MSLPVRWAAPLLLLGLLLAYALTSPASVNGDGLGYLRQAQSGGLAPGHVAYLPALRALTWLKPAAAPLDLERPARWLSIVCAVLALGLFLDGARRVRGDRPALFATALLGLSYGFFRSAQEVEVYAVAALFAVSCLWSLLRMLTGAPRWAPVWSLAAGVCCGVAMLFHLTLGLLMPSLFLLLGFIPPPGQRLRCLLACLAGLALAGGLPLLLVLGQQGQLAPAAAWRWLRSADHGLPYPHSPATPLIALWGLARSLVHAPYPHEAPLLRVVFLSAAGVLGWAALAFRWARRRREHPLPRPARWLLVGWVLPLGLFGLLFYPSDTERWIFLLPALALLLAPAAGGAGLAILLGVALLNLLSVELPLALDDAPRRRAAAVDRLTGPDDLVLSPGHGWDELIGMRSPAPPERFLLTYFVGADRSLGLGLERLHQQIARAFRARRRIFVARMQDEDDPRGFKELERLGLSPASFTALFARYRPRPTGAPDLWQLTVPPGQP